MLCAFKLFFCSPNLYADYYKNTFTKLSDKKVMLCSEVKTVYILYIIDYMNIYVYIQGQAVN